MEIYLEHPSYLWVLVAALPLLAFAAIKSYAIAPRWQRITSFGLRVLGLAAVILAVCRPVLRLDNPDQATVYLVDVSDSIEFSALEQCAGYMRDASRDLSDHQQVAVIAFGGEPRVHRALASEQIVVEDSFADTLFHRTRKAQAKTAILAIERDLSGDDVAQRLDDARRRLADLQAIEADLSTVETNLRDALRLARSLLPDDVRRRIVLFSDGNWTRHSPEQEFALLSHMGIPVDVCVVDNGRTAEVVAERLVAPGEVRIRQPVELELQVNSTEACQVTMKLFRNRFLLRTQELELEAGRNVVRIPKQELEEGFHEFEVVIVAANDPRPENNIARAVVVVDGRPRVLLIESDERDARYLEQALRDEEIQIEVRPPVGFPGQLNDLLAYDVLIMSDVAATDLHSSQLGMVKQYVKDFGGGLVMLGGERSFGLGGYYRTPIEDALPVRMPIKKTIEKPSLGLVLVLDRSGSMAGEKLALAKEAAIASVEVLKNKDLIGVVVFDEAADWVVDLQPASNRAEIVSQISRIADGGGTYILSGLYQAYERLSESSAKLKHIIVLSDGHTSGTHAEHLNIVDVMSSEQITVSTVGIGDADQALLTAMADHGQGEAYFTNDFGNIPQIFTKETLRASKSMLVEEPFIPTATGVQDQMLRGIEIADAPLLLGYVSTTAKERARLLLVSDYGDPILAHWNYGLGRSVAFTSDAKNHWASDWIAWEQFGKFWSQVVRSVMSTGTTSALQQSADIRVERGEVHIAIDTRDRQGRFLDVVRPSVAIVEASGSIRSVVADHVAPGLHQAKIPIEDYGEFMRIRVDSRLDGDVVGLRNYAVVESYPPEYRAAVADRSLLERAAALTGGRFDPPVASSVEFEGPPARGLRDLWRLLALFAAVLLPLDIAVRRLG